MTDASEHSGPTRRRRRVWRLAAIPAVLYVAWCVLLVVKQGDMLFPRGIPNAHIPKDRPKGVRSEFMSCAGGFEIEVWFIPHPTSDPDHSRPTVFFFHGNAELIDDCMGVVRDYHERGFNVVLAEYRGYGRSGGEPTQEGIVEDMVAVYDVVTAVEPRVDPARIVFHGRSLGGGVAAQLAAKRPPAALILESTFTSVASFAAGYGVPPVLVSNPFRTDRVLPELPSRVLILHGASDTIVPVAHGRALAALCPSGTYVELRGGHMDLEASDPARYRRAIDALLQSVAR